MIEPHTKNRRNLRVWNSAVLVGYASLLILLAFFFFSHELLIIPYREPGLTEDFIVRFTAFWFISFLLTIMVYLLNLSLNYPWLPRAEKIVALRAGKLMLGIGLLGATIVVSVITFLNAYSPA